MPARDWVIKNPGGAAETTAANMAMTGFGVRTHIIVRWRAVMAVTAEIIGRAAATRVVAARLQLSLGAATIPLLAGRKTICLNWAGRVMMLLPAEEGITP